MKKELSTPSLSRLCAIYELLVDFEKKGIKRVSSTELGKTLAFGSHNIRKDISYLGEIGSYGAGYDVGKLRRHIGNALCLTKKRPACVVGLGRLGSAMLAYKGFEEKGYSIIAGFDSDINLLDIIKTTVPVYPAHEITEIVRIKKIELGIIAVPASAAKDAAHKLILGGIRGIVNFSPEVIPCDDKSVHVANIDIIKEFTMLSALLSIDEQKNMAL